MRQLLQRLPFILYYQWVVFGTNTVYLKQFQFCTVRNDTLGTLTKGSQGN